MKLFLKTKDFSVSGESFELHWDEEFQMLRTSPVPENLEGYYDSDNYISHTDSSTGLVDQLYQKVKRLNLKKKLQLIDNQIDISRNLLDIGAGTGDFLLYTQENGYTITGVEPNEKARTLAKDKGLDLKPGLNNLRGQQYDIITLWHVLEHLPELEKQIVKIEELLAAKGTLIIAVPNFKSFDAKHYGRYWAGYDVPRHLWHFSKESIAKLFKPHNLEVVQIRPMWFDAFYVSLLSEKYKGNKLYLLSAFFVGLWSNIKACFTKEHSSLIYVLKRAK
ncbi:class I SAM-dependent methyltransferase [Flagellimonas nanhaiensis]|uniref:Class I SAM-dependent methyltransferase n=1 Tax=Flagellimonas nanhaiensis TaxID=2292706 RepID=A0A371JQM5_9FLAO|nr:class I SAM-dependent methyltransferase [Allomuricauda nanhaiensis]RDY59814.1 class I SAM-dependent methyltransferase [Allomuricauda nanhaiensis]